MTTNTTLIMNTDDFLKGCENTGTALTAVQLNDRRFISAEDLITGTIPAASGTHRTFPDLADCTQALVDACHGASLGAGWWTDPASGMDLKAEVNSGSRFGKALVAEKLCLTHSEISEGMEGHRKSKMDDKLPHRSMLEVELADAVIRIFDLAGALHMDLGGAVAEKLAFNAVRPDHKLENRQAEGGKAY